jgi:hypothetical protein
VFAGQFITENMRHCQMRQDKFDSELRQKGYVSLAKVFAVTLEPPGKFAILTKGELLSGLLLDFEVGMYQLGGPTSPVQPFKVQPFKRPGLQVADP